MRLQESSLISLEFMIWLEILKSGAMIGLHLIMDIHGQLNLLRTLPVPLQLSQTTTKSKEAVVIQVQLLLMANFIIQDMRQLLNLITISHVVSA